MAGNSALEFRLELYTDAGLPEELASRISKVLSQRWPEAWDIKLPAQPSPNHPAEWHAVVPLSQGLTAESLHRELAKEILALDPSHSFHFRTRWAFQETPDHQEVYEERWRPGRS
jgi:hypothetical protein